MNEVRALCLQPTEVNVQLEVGTVAESVTISATAGETAINTQTLRSAIIFTAEQNHAVAAGVAHVVQLLSLQRGHAGGLRLRSRADQANVTLDGVDVNEQQTGLDVIEDVAFERTQAFSSVLRVTSESVQEFRVTTTNPNATQGRSSGGQVALVTKSGTNDFRGSLYLAHRTR